MIRNFISLIVLSLSLSAAAEFTPVPCVSPAPTKDPHYVLTFYKASDRFQAVGQIGVKVVGQKLKFTARADADDGLTAQGEDLEKGCILKKKIFLFNKCAFDVKNVSWNEGKFSIETQEGVFKYTPSECAFSKNDKSFNAFQVTKGLSRRISVLPTEFPKNVPGVFADPMP